MINPSPNSVLFFAIISNNAMMSHRKIRSEGHVPFSWEEKPGISKFSHHKSSSNIHDHLKIISEKLVISSNEARAHQRINIVPPPPCKSQPQQKSSSRKGIWWQDDPFLAALKSCMKNGSKANNNESNKWKNFSKSASVFSCKHSCDVENDSFLKFTKLPPLPKERYKVKSFVKSSH